MTVNFFLLEVPLDLSKFYEHEILHFYWRFPPYNLFRYFLKINKITIFLMGLSTYTNEKGFQLLFYIEFLLHSTLLIPRFFHSHLRGYKQHNDCNSRECLLVLYESSETNNNRAVFMSASDKVINQWFPRFSTEGIIEYEYFLCILVHFIKRNDITIIITS